MLFDEGGLGVHTAEHFQQSQAVQRAIRVPDGVEDLGRAIARRLIAVGGGEPRTQLAFEATDMAGGDQQVASADAEVQIAARQRLEGEAQLGSGFLRSHLDYRSGDVGQKVAIGLSGDPVPKGTDSGAAVKRNSQRLRDAAASPNASRSQLSSIGTPMAISSSWCMG